MKKTGEHIRVNFGQSPFVFDIDGMMSASDILLIFFLDIRSYPLSSRNMNSEGPHPRGFWVAPVSPVVHGHPIIQTAPLTPSEVVAHLANRRAARAQLLETLQQSTLPRYPDSYRRFAEFRHDREDMESLQIAASRLSIISTRTNADTCKQDEKKQIRMQIEATSTAKLAPKLNETELIQQLVCHKQQE